MLELRRSRVDHPDAVRMGEEVQQYYVELYGGPDTDPLVPEDFAPPRGGFLLGYSEGTAVAMGGWSLIPDHEPPTAKIRRMYVAPSARRRGYGAQVLTALEADARAAGATELMLTTGRPQVDAIALYRAAGYADVPAFGYYAEIETAVHLGKRL